MITLYYFPLSQHSRRVVSLLEEAGIEYQAHLVNMMEGDHMSEEYMAINPNHQVPSLVDEDICLHESNVIMRYLCDKFQLSNWYPKAIEQRALVEQWLDWGQCRFAPVVKDIVFNMLFAEKAGLKPDQDAIIKAQENLIALANILEKHLAKHPYLAGNHATIADLALASNMFHLSLAKQQPSTPALQAWYTKIAGLKGFQKSLPEF